MALGNGGRDGKEATVMIYVGALASGVVFVSLFFGVAAAITRVVRYFMDQ